MELVIAPMTEADINAIKPQFNDSFKGTWSFATLKTDFANEHSMHIVAKVSHAIVGFAAILTVLDECELTNIVVHRDYRHLGIGSKLLENIIETSKTLGCSTIYLEVNVHNTAAIHLYEKYHFQRIGLRKKYYNNTDDAILMQREATNEK